MRYFPQIKDQEVVINRLKNVLNTKVNKKFWVRTKKSKSKSQSKSKYLEIITAEVKKEMEIKDKSGKI